MALTINRRVGDGWATVALVPATLARDVWSTLLHGRTGQGISDGWLDAGTVVHIEPEDVGHIGHAFTESSELPLAHDVVYDAQGMKYRISHEDWDAVAINEEGR